MAKPSTARRARVAATTASTQDYLAAIYDLAGSGKPVIGARLAKHMAISAPAVTEAMHRLARGGCVKIGRGHEPPLSTHGRHTAGAIAPRRLPLEHALPQRQAAHWSPAA